MAKIDWRSTRRPDRADKRLRPQREGDYIVPHHNGQVDIRVSIPHSNAMTESYVEFRIEDEWSSEEILAFRITSHELVMALHGSNIPSVPARVVTRDRASRLGRRLQVFSELAPKHYDEEGARKWAGLRAAEIGAEKWTVRTNRDGVQITYNRWLEADAPEDAL